MDVNYEYIDPFDKKYDYFMRVEHLGRYYFASNILEGAKNTLDLACANGYGTYILSHVVEKICGIDRNEKYLEIAKEKNSAKNITYKKMDLDVGKIDGIYDSIVCFETLEHLKYPEAFLKNLYDILEEHGVLILSFPNSTYEKFENGKNKDSYHLHVFEYNTVVEFLKKIGFTIRSVYGQSYINKIVNNKITNYRLTNLENDAKTIGYPNNNDISETYSYILILDK